MSGITLGQTYYYKVRAKVIGSDPRVDNGNPEVGYGDFSAEASARANYPQPSSINVNPGSIGQRDSYMITVGNGNNMTLDVLYRFNNGSPIEIDGWPRLNGSGQFLQSTDYSTAPGTYTFIGIRNTLNGSLVPWVNVSTTEVVNAQPSSINITPSSVNQGDSYVVTVGNGANMTIDVQYTYNNGPVATAYGWAMLDGQGMATQNTAGAARGLWTIVGVKNSVNPNFIPMTASVTVN